MKKTGKYIAVIVAVAVVIGLALYFRPLPLSELVSGEQKILITHVEVGVENGKAYTDSANYNDLTDEQKDRVLSLFQDYSYKRTFGTILSDGSLSGLGSDLVHIFTYKEDTLVNTISVSSSGSVSVNDKTYALSKSSEFIEQLLETISG